MRTGISGWVLVDCGVNDQTVAQSAIDELGTGGGGIFFRDAHYTFTTELQVAASTENLELVAESWNVIFDQRTTADSSVIAVLGGLGTECVNVVLRNITFYFRADATYPAIYFTYADDCMVEHCYIKAPDWLGVASQLGGIGILWSHTTRFSVIDNYLTNMNSSCLQCCDDSPSRDETGEGYYGLIIRNHIFPTEYEDACNDDGMCLHKLYLGETRCIVAFNQIHNAGYGGIRNAPMSDSIIAFNDIKDPDDDGIYCGGRSDLVLQGLIIIGNKITGAGADGIGINNNRYDIVIGNDVYNPTGDGFFFGDFFSKSTVSLNRVFSAGGWGFNVEGAGGAEVAAHNVFTGNITHDCASGCMLLTADTEDNIVNSNSFQEGDPTDNGVRNVINGLGQNGTNDPATAGNWNGNGYEGVLVKWDVAGPTHYLSVYTGGAWWDWVVA